MLESWIIEEIQKLEQKENHQSSIQLELPLEEEQLEDEKSNSVDNNININFIIT